MVLTCALVLLLCLNAIGDETINDALDPTCLLDARITDFNAAPLTVNISENLIAEVNYESQQSKPFAATKTQNISYITSPPAAALPDDGLRQIIEQIRSVKIEQENTPKPEDPASLRYAGAGGGQKAEDGSQKTEDGQKTRDEGRETPANPDKSGQGQARDEISDEVMRDIEEATKKPGQIRNPLGLAEILFKTGKFKPAAVCYKQALAAITPGDANESHQLAALAAGQRDWILFQTGNCLQYDDPNAARESYAELLRTSPDSPWADAARSRHDLVEWLQKEQPLKLIEELKP